MHVMCGMKWNHLIAVVVASGALVSVNAAAEAKPGEDRQTQTLTVQELLDWPQWGRGEIVSFRDEALQMVEAEDSLGLMITSPKPYEGPVVISYEAMTLRPATVLVVMLSATAPEAAQTQETGDSLLDLPTGYDGGMEPWIDAHTHYFFAFHNAPHNRHPFVVRSGLGGWDTLTGADERYVRPGRWHQIEVGRSEDRLWLAVDGRTVFETTDSDPLPEWGHVAFRIRGTGLERASCLIRNVEIEHPR